MANVRIAPSILSADFGKMGEEVKRIEVAGADLIHCDVMDGVFVQNITFGPKMIADIKRRTELTLDTHLMIVNPEKYVKNFASAGADIISVHYEACQDVGRALSAIKCEGVQCGVVINPETPIAVLEPYLEQCNLVLVMSVHPGFGGQTFIEGSLSKLEALAKIKRKRSLDYAIEVDGGINAQNSAAVKNAGAEIIVAGNAVFGSSSPSDVIKLMRS